MRFRDTAGLEGGSRTMSPGVRASSSSVKSFSGREMGGVSLGVSRTCCNELRGSARTGEEGCVVIRSSISEVAIVEPGERGTSRSVMVAPSLVASTLAVSYDLVG